MPLIASVNVPAGFRDDFVDPDWHTALAVAFVGGFHEAEQFDGFRWLDRKLAGFEELCNFGGDVFIALVAGLRDNSVDRCGVTVDAGRSDSLVSENRRTVFGFAATDASIR